MVRTGDQVIEAEDQRPHRSLWECCLGTGTLPAFSVYPLAREKYTDEDDKMRWLWKARKNRALWNHRLLDPNLLDGSLPWGKGALYWNQQDKLEVDGWRWWFSGCVEGWAAAVAWGAAAAVGIESPEVNRSETEKESIMTRPKEQMQQCCKMKPRKMGTGRGN